ncbi:MAG: signal peptide peptidase SppA [Cytophagales bacterium]|nr:signal peptide peptidase SppA [Cytophagales bacterium]
MAFLRNLLATITGLIVFSILGIIILFAVMGALAASGDEIPTVKDNSVLYMPLSGVIVEQAIENPLDKAFGDETAQLAILDAVNAIKAAADDDKIKGIYIETKYIGASFSSLQEIRDALLDFKESGKFIYAYGEYMSEGDYYIASVADEIYLNPQGALEFNGLALNIMFYKGLFDKLDIKPVIFRPTSNKFKSFVEPYIRKDISEESKLQYSELLNSVYDFYLENVADTRGIDQSELERISDEMLVSFPEDAKKYGLVSQVEYEDVVKDVMRDTLGIDEAKDIPYVSWSDYAKVAKADEEYSKDKIAVIVANGPIYQSVGEDDGVGGEQFARYIRKARDDKKVKAIVLRINSPGGSLTGSDMIWREVMLTKGVKPIIASMSGVAASGGYYIAMAADTIVAQSNTITGSIGIFSMLYDFETFLDGKLGLTHDVVCTGEYSDFITVTRPFTEYENSVMQRGVDRGYLTFTSKAAEGRGMSLEDLQAVAEGRVWSGLQAKENGLVDVLGSYEDALNLAAQAADIEEFSLKIYPQQKPFFEKLVSDLTGQAQGYFTQSDILAPYRKQLKSLKEMEGIQARMPAEIEIH